MLRVLCVCALPLGLLYGCESTGSASKAKPVSAAPEKAAPAVAVPAKGTAVTLENLLGEMTDLENLTRFPEPDYVCKQFSSYDRRSTDPSVKTEENWFANGDSGQYLRVEEKADRKEYVMMDTDGPGAIVRIWSANPDGVMRVYLDGSEKPVIEASMKDFLGGKVAGFPRPITGERSKGWNSYFPIPYAKHCKVTSDKGKFYYHVNYRTYPAGTGVATFASDQLEAYKGKIEDVAKKLASPGQIGASGATENVYTDEFDETIPAGQAGETTLYGPSVIVEIMISIEGEHRDQALRDLLGEIDFDEKASVSCPIGDMFGSAPGINAYESLPMGVTKEGRMWSHWMMPFKSTCTLRAKNLGKQDIRVRGHVKYRDYKWTDRSMHFHAKWRIERDIPTRPFRDWNYVEVMGGKGLYVGDALFVANPVKNWWGEGDEKIYIDGEKFPSHFGTGTEDYYGYAWSNSTLFTHAYHNQTRCDGPGNYGFSAVNRWHILDAIPFTTGLKVDVEAWHSHKEVKYTLAQVSYWYAMAGAKDNYPPIKEENVILPKIPELKEEKGKGKK
jgi:hypothetical protein